MANKNNAYAHFFIACYALMRAYAKSVVCDDQIRFSHTKHALLLPHSPRPNHILLLPYYYNELPCLGGEKRKSYSSKRYVMMMIFIEKKITSTQNSMARMGSRRRMDELVVTTGWTRSRERLGEPEVMAGWTRMKAAGIHTTTVTTGWTRTRERLGEPEVTAGWTRMKAVGIHTTSVAAAHTTMDTMLTTRDTTLTTRNTMTTRAMMTMTRATMPTTRTTSNA